MPIKKLLVAVLALPVMSLALLGCPDEAADTKPDPATAAAAASVKGTASAAPAAASAAPAKSGGW